MSSSSTEISRSHVDDEAVSANEEQCVGKQNRQLPFYFHFKGALDRILAAILLVPFLPVIGLLVLLVRWTSKGPGIFRQTRVGRHGRNYMMLKLRSMRSDAEAQTGPAWTQGNDPRITPLGRWLRKLHLDELPQLFNVLRGEMSLIGPRPERPEFVKVLQESITDYDRRLDVLPGITGLAQINLPPDSDLDSVRRKQVLDLQYTKEASLWLDLRILMATTMRIVGIPGSVASWAARVQRKAELVNLEKAVTDTEAPATTDSITLKSLVEQLNEQSSNGNGHAVGDNGDGNGVLNADPHESVESESNPTRRHPK